MCRGLDLFHGTGSGDLDPGKAWHFAVGARAQKVPTVGNLAG
jgi:hypothetical protein